MNRYQGNTLLVELVIVLLFFTLSLAIALQAFTHAQEINRDAQAQNSALMRAEDAAETLAASDDAEAALTALGFTPAHAGYEAAGDGYRLTAALYRVTQPSGTLTTVELTGWRGETALFTFPAARYREVSAP